MSTPSGLPSRSLAHPKFAYFPSGRDYVFTHTFRPFVTFMHPASYRSPSVNTDRFGLRERYDADGNYIDLDTARERYPSCNVLLGGSTAFGVGASSDHTTVSALLNEPGRPCFNLGLRAASSRQELALFLAFKHLLPPVHAIVLFSGANECLLAASPRVGVFPGYGAVYNEHVEKLRAAASDEPANSSDRATRVVRALTTRLDRVGRALDRQPEESVPRLDAPDLSFDERLDTLLALAADTLETWSWIGRATGANVAFVLQPIAPWTHKALTPSERERVDVDRGTPAVATVERIEVYERLRHDISAACAGLAIEFHDSNQWFDGGDADHLDIFYDVAHLTDEGNAFVADCMRKELACLSHAGSASSPGSI